jgi:hypothetical protein
MKICPAERQTRIVTHDEHPSPDHGPADISAGKAFPALGLDQTQ